MAPVVKELKKNKRFQVVTVVSAQHRNLLDQVLRLYQLKSDRDLDLMKKGQSLFDITTRILNRFDPTLDRLKPDLVLVHGDTTTTLGGALSSFYKKIPVGHVEAGLRTRDLYQPFPEEMNRRLTDSLTTLFFPPTREAKQHLLSENHTPNHIFVTGNTVIDALLEINRHKRNPKNPRLRKILQSLNLNKNKVVLMTAHRRENFGERFSRIFKTIRDLGQEFPHVHWIYPVHPNPRVKKSAEKIFKKITNIHLLSPVDYGDLVTVMKKSTLVVTDSGGLQEEAPSLGKPVLVLRDVTERPEAVRAGTVRLVGANPRKIKKEVIRLLSDKRYYQKMANAVNPYGDGKAAKRIRHAIEWYFGMKRNKPVPFRDKS
ncbi:UDP-N-acetylglucosamine 2-epimerase (non-hydrolyzing) [bacterium F11]|nr:UDP-N-acetylglucosamine 2-epimerase (non-hydrolyzing) [bacterium F11]